jgi:hypothetical protein
MDHPLQTSGGMLRVLPLLGLVACVTPSQSQTDQASDVVEQAAPHAYCEGCGVDRVVGDPVGIDATWWAMCRDTFGEEYECMEEDFTLSIECVVGTCDVPSPEYVVGEGGGTVIPTATGDVQIRVTMDGYTKTFPTFGVYVPDTIDVECRSGLDAHPCTTGANPEPVTLKFALEAGEHVLYGHGDFSFEHTAPGYWSGATWTSIGPGNVTRVQWGNLVKDLDLVIGLHSDHLDLGQVDLGEPRG